MLTTTDCLVHGMHPFLRRPTPTYLQDLAARAVLPHEPGHGLVGNGRVLDVTGSLGSLLTAVHKDQHLDRERGRRGQRDLDIFSCRGH